MGSETGGPHVPEYFLKINEVRERVSLSKTHIYRLIRAGTFPRPVPLGPRRTAFLESEVQKWMLGRIAERDRGSDLTTPASREAGVSSRT